MAYDMSINNVKDRYGTMYAVSIDNVRGTTDTHTKGSFDKDGAASLTISEAAKNAASSGGKVLMSSEDGKVIEKDKITNLTGYSSSQIEALYLRGKVSRANYEREMDKKEQLEEIKNSSIDNKDSNNKLEDDDTSDKDTKATNDSKVTSNASDVKQSGDDGKQPDNAIYGENQGAAMIKAFEKAAENGRADIIEPIFNDDAKKAHIIAGAV